MEIKGLVKEILEKKNFRFKNVGCPAKTMGGSTLILEKENGEIVNLNFPKYYPGMADRKFLIGSEIEYTHQSHSSGNHWTESISAEKYTLKVLTGKLKDEEFVTNFIY